MSAADPASSPPEEQPQKFTEAQFQPALVLDAKSIPVLATGAVAEDDARRDMREKTRRSLLPPALHPQYWLTVAPVRFKVRESLEQEPIPPAPGWEPQDTPQTSPRYPFDAATVPWPLTLFVPRSHPHVLAAAAVHDFMYEKGRPDLTPDDPFGANSPDDRRYSRDYADDVMAEALGVLGVNWFWGWAIWRSTRVGGRFYWWANKDRVKALGEEAQGANTWVSRAMCWLFANAKWLLLIILALALALPLALSVAYPLVYYGAAVLLTAAAPALFYGGFFLYDLLITGRVRAIRGHYQRIAEVQRLCTEAATRSSPEAPGV